MKDKADDKGQNKAGETRRAFLKKAAAGAVFAAPVMETFTKSDILLKSALAQTGPLSFVITSSENMIGPVAPAGTITPLGNVSVVRGGSQSFTIKADGTSYNTLRIDVDGAPWLNLTAPFPPVATTYTFTNVQANHTIRLTIS